MRKLLTALLVSLLLCIVVLGQQPEKKPAQQPPPPPAEFKIPPEESKRENPMKGSAASVAVGKKIFASQCAMCHGDAGDGKGELADSLKLKLKDWHDPAALKDMTDGDLFYIVTEGKGHMPDQKGRMKDDQKWSLINFIRTFAAKKEGEPEKKEEKPKPQ